MAENTKYRTGNNEECTDAESHSSEIDSARYIDPLEALQSAVSRIWQDFLNFEDTIMRKKIDCQENSEPRGSASMESTSNVQEVQGKSELEEGASQRITIQYRSADHNSSMESTYNVQGVQGKSELEEDASQPITIQYRIAEHNSETGSSDTAETSATQSDFDASADTCQSEDSSTIFIEYKTFGTREETASGKCTLTDPESVAKSELSSTSMVRAPQNQNEPFSPESSADIPPMSHSSVATSIDNKRIAEGLSQLPETYDNKYRDASEKRLASLNEGALVLEHTGDNRQQSSTYIGSGSCKPSNMFVEAHACVYPDIDKAPKVGSLEEMREILLFLESFPKTPRNDDGKSEEEIQRIHDIQPEVAAPSQDVKVKNVDVTENANLDEDGIHQSCASQKKPWQNAHAASDVRHGNIQQPFKAEEAISAAEGPLAQPPPASPTAVQPTDSGTLLKSSEYKSGFFEHQLRELRATLARHCKTVTMATGTLLFMTVVVTVVLGYDYLFPPPISDHAESAEPLKVAVLNETVDENAGYLFPAAPIEISVTEDSILDINEET